MKFPARVSIIMLSMAVVDYSLFRDSAALSIILASWFGLITGYFHGLVEAKEAESRKDDQSDN